MSHTCCPLRSFRRPLRNCYAIHRSAERFLYGIVIFSEAAARECTVLAGKTRRRFRGWRSDGERQQWERMLGGESEREKGEERRGGDEKEQRGLPDRLTWFGGRCACCANPFSARTDYCLFHIVWGRERGSGSKRLSRDPPLPGRKALYLFIPLFIHLLTYSHPYRIYICLKKTSSSPSVCRRLRISMRCMKTT